MKKLISTIVMSVAIAASFFASTANAQPPQHGMPAGMDVPQVSPMSEEYKADLNRELAPRGEKIGLLIVSHGSGSPTWDALIEEICDNVRALDAKDHVFAAIEGCNMEFDHENDIVAGFSRLEKAGCDAVVVVPVFIYPTSHVQFDVVTILGIYGDPKAREDAHEEGARILRTKLPIALAPTFSAGDLLKDYVVSEAKKTSVDPKNERLLVIAHGDEEYQGLVDRLTQSAIDAAAEEVGFDAVGTAYCEMGQTFAKNVKPVIEKNTKDGKKTVVVAIYLASSAKSFLARISASPMGATKDNPKANSLEGLDYVGSETALGKFEGTAPYIYEVAVETSKN